MISINWHPTDRELRQFAGIWFPAFWAIAGLMLGVRFGWWNVVIPIWLLVAGISAVGLLRPQLMRPLFVAWMCAAFPIGWLVSHLLLAAVFYLVLTPLGLLSRVLGRDKLKMRFDRNATTYWVRRGSPPSTDRYFRQF